MTLEWIGDAILLLVVLPAVVYLLRGVYQAATGIAVSTRRIAVAAERAAADLDAAALLVTTRERVGQTIAAAADYGGSLDTILDDAEGV